MFGNCYRFNFEVFIDQFQVEAAKRRKAQEAMKTTEAFEEKYAKIERMLEMQREQSQGSRTEAMQLKAKREEELRKKTEEKVRTYCAVVAVVTPAFTGMIFFYIVFVLVFVVSIDCSMRDC